MHKKKKNGEQRTMSVSHIDLLGLRGHVIKGVFMFLLAATTISCKRGIPRVTFISPRPARWKVFKLSKKGKEEAKTVNQPHKSY